MIVETVKDSIKSLQKPLNSGVHHILPGALHYFTFALYKVVATKPSKEVQCYVRMSTHWYWCSAKYCPFYHNWKDKHPLSFVWHVNFGLSWQIHINHHAKWSAKTDGQHRLLIRAEPVTAIGIRREGVGGVFVWCGGGYLLIWKLCCCALYQPVGVFKQAHMVVATSFGKGGWVVGGWARARISHSQYWVELRRRALKLSFQAQQKPSIWPLLKLRTSLLSSPLADWASWSRSNSINSVNPCHLRVLHFFSCLT